MDNLQSQLKMLCLEPYYYWKSEIHHTPVFTWHWPHTPWWPRRCLSPHWCFWGGWWWWGRWGRPARRHLDGQTDQKTEWHKHRGVKQEAVILIDQLKQIQRGGVLYISFPASAPGGCSSTWHIETDQCAAHCILSPDRVMGPDRTRPRTDCVYNQLSAGEAQTGMEKYSLTNTELEAVNRLRRVCVHKHTHVHKTLHVQKSLGLFMCVCVVEHQRNTAHGGERTVCVCACCLRCVMSVINSHWSVNPIKPWECARGCRCQM